MIIGSVHPSGDAVVQIQLCGPDGTTLEIHAVVDTGFDDAIALPRQMIKALKLLFREQVRYQLADGSKRFSRTFLVELDWFGRWRKVPAAEMESTPLLGMTVLRGAFLGIEVVDGGRVEITALRK